MNMSLEGFKHQLCVDYIDKGIPFKAYWHPNGHGILRTGPVEYTVGLGHNRKTKTRKASKATLAKWDKNVQKLLRQIGFNVYTIEFDGYTVEFDGKETSEEGGF